MLVENEPAGLDPSAVTSISQRPVFSKHISMMRGLKNLAHHEAAIKNGLLFALMLVAAGPAVDYSRAFIAQHQLARAVNLTALELHKLNGRSDEHLNEIARRRFQASYPDNTTDIVTKMELSVVNGRIKIKATAKVPTLVISLAGINAVHVSSRSDIDTSDRGGSIAGIQPRTDHVKSEDVASLQITRY